MRRRLMDWLLCAAGLLLCALALGLIVWAVGPVRGAPVPFARPAKPAPSLAGSWWWPYDEGDPRAGWEIHLLPDGTYAARHWLHAGPSGCVWSGTWRLDGPAVRVREAMLPPGEPGERDRDWSFPVAALRRTR